MSKPLPVIICDDSLLARKQMQLALQQWQVDITLTENGLQALEAIRAGKGHLLFLDLNMPIMNGFDVLKRIQQEDLACITLVVSGDIQAESILKAKSLGALGLIAKPINENILKSSLQEFGLLDELKMKQNRSADSVTTLFESGQLYDSVREISNIAMGRSANDLAKALGSAVVLPVPKVDIMSMTELELVLNDYSDRPSGSTCISQGFIGPGAIGEALLIFENSNIDTWIDQLSTQSTPEANREHSTLMTLSQLLIGNFFHQLSHLFHLSFSQGFPVIFKLNDESLNLSASSRRHERYLVIEIEYRLSNTSAQCELLMFFTSNSIPTLLNQLEQLS